MGHQVRVKRTVVQLAECNPVRNDRRSQLVSVSDDVRRLEQLLSFQSAYSAVTLIGLEYAFTEFLLVQTLLHSSRDVPTPDLSLGRIVRDAMNSPTLTARATPGLRGMGSRAEQ